MNKIILVAIIVLCLGMIVQADHPGHPGREETGDVKEVMEKLERERIQARGGGAAGGASIEDDPIVQASSSSSSRRTTAGGRTRPTPKGDRYYYVDSENNIRRGRGDPGGRTVVPDSFVRTARSYGGIDTADEGVYTFTNERNNRDGSTTTSAADITIDERTGQITSRAVFEQTLDKEGDIVPGSIQSVASGYDLVQDPEGKYHPVLNVESTGIYDTQTGAELGDISVVYDRADNELVSTPGTVTIRGTGADASTIYYSTSLDDDGNSRIDINKIDDMPLSEEQRDQIRREIVATGSLDIAGALDTLSWQQSLGRFMRAFTEYRGLRTLTALAWPSYAEDVQERRQELQQKFCGFSGIQNCFTSTICGSVYDIDADNLLVGRGPTGDYVSSVSLNAERSIPVEIEGMTRQQLIDLFGNTTVIAGRLINLTDPNFDPDDLGRQKLRLYHVQFSITNNAVEVDRDFHYNIRFVRVPVGIDSSYGTPIQEAKWYPEDVVLGQLDTARDDLYKFSATEYTGVCLKFRPKLPTGHAAASRLVDKFCVPFVEYAGGATEIGEAGAAAAAPAVGPGTPAAQIPGALI